MSRPRTEHVAYVKQQLVTRIRDGHHLPGRRFLSNRALARLFEVSYQTADILIRELVHDGLLIRRPGSGTYLPGPKLDQSSVLLIFHPRAKRKNSFGANLLDRLTDRLEKDHIDWRMSWTCPDTSSKRPITTTRFPIIWDRPEAVNAVIRQRRFALVLNDRPPAGLGATLIDSVSVDDYSGGAHAAQFLTLKNPRPRRMAVLAGPRNDARSAARVSGFLSVAQAAVFHARTWFYEAGLSVVDRLLASRPEGIFCCNDRFAQAVLRRTTDRGIPRPLIIGFDDAPIAQWLNLTTIAIPWEELVAAAVGAVKRRQLQPFSSAIAQLVSTRLVVRS